MFEEVCIIKDEIHRRFDVCAVDTYRVGSQEGVNNVFERLAEVILNLICENRLFDLDGGDDLFFQKGTEFVDFGFCLCLQRLEFGCRDRLFSHMELEVNPGRARNKIFVRFHFDDLDFFLITFGEKIDMVGT